MESPPNKRKLETDRAKAVFKRRQPPKKDADAFVSYVQQQPLGNLVIRTKDNDREAPVSILNGSCQTCNVHLHFECKKNLPEHFVSINGEQVASGSYPGISAKKIKVKLAEQALDNLKSDCFFIYRKEGVCVSNEEVRERIAGPKPPPVVDGNNAGLKMMLKMGWSGGGLGSNEQGNPDVVKVYQNISREGLGFQNILQGVTKVLQDYAESESIQSISFDPSFTKEERVRIHQLAAKYQLKSKSGGTGKNRRVTVFKPVDPLTIVRDLLKAGGENEAFRIQIPTRFEHLFNWDLYRSS